jgi:diguanylate cyclase (GGDEF)-like protein
MEPIVSLALSIQWAGVVTVAGMLLFLTQSVHRRFLSHWAGAWCCLALSLTTLSLAFRSASLQLPLLTVYFFAEYAFGALLVSGCRAYAGRPLLPSSLQTVLLGAVLVALVLAYSSEDFNVQFVPHAAILTAFFLTAFVALRAIPREGRPGLTVMLVALLLLAADFAHYVPVFALAVIRGPAGRFSYLRYTSLIDLGLETMLGFGTVMVTMESLLREVTGANRELESALGRLEVLARTDALTDALNRHAFHTFATKEGQAAFSGCAAIVDVDRLKFINDTFGHLAGDAAIRRVARAIRKVIRADDLLFRWGGDEFLVLLQDVGESEAQGRLEAVNRALGEARPEDTANAIPLSVSFGIAGCGAGKTLAAAIEEADRHMYLGKRGSNP